MHRRTQSQALQIAVVGHTNTGKTSLLRTLTRDKHFGTVSPMPSTTRHVEATSLLLGQQLVLELYDTPGLEDSIALLELLETQSDGSGARLDGPGRIAQFLNGGDAAGRFEQEAKVLRQLQQSDAALYVIDARDPVLAKHRDELAILHSAGVPILPLLNFVGTPKAHEKAWRDALARLGLHVVVSFDTVAPARDGERTLYGKLATLLDERGAVLLALAESHERAAVQRRQEATALLAELLIDAAALRVPLDESAAGAALTRALADFNQTIRAREQRCVNALLALYGFTQEDVQASELPFSQGAWRDDLFSAEALKAFGVSLGSAAAAGAAAGLGVDLMLGGTSLGAGAAVGAVLGGGAHTLRRYGRRVGASLMSVLTGSRYLRVDDAILQVLLTRQWYLIRALEGRGHAAIERVAIGDKALEALWQSSLRKLIAVCREHPQWSALESSLGWNAARRENSEQIARLLDDLLRQWLVKT